MLCCLSCCCWVLRQYRAQHWGRVLLQGSICELLLQLLHLLLQLLHLLLQLGH